MRRAQNAVMRRRGLFGGYEQNSAEVSKEGKRFPVKSIIVAVILLVFLSQFAIVILELIDQGIDFSNF